MTLDEAIKHAEEIVDFCEDSVSKYDMTDAFESYMAGKDGECAEEHRQLAEWLRELKRLKEQEPCEMSAEEYRQRMIQAFHNADTDELIAVCVLPTEKEFEHLEWLLKTHYKKEPCVDAISRDELLKAIDTWDKFGCDADTKLVPYQDHYIPYIHYDDVVKCIKGMPSVTPQPKTGHWNAYEVFQGGIKEEWIECSECKWSNALVIPRNYCPKCGARMMEKEDDEE